MINTVAALKRRLHGVATGNGLKARLVRGGLGSAGIQAANRVLSLALGVVLARTLGAEGYGIYAYAFALMSLLMVPAEAGVPTLIMREVAANQGREEWGVLRGLLQRATQFVALTSTTISLLALVVVWCVAGSLTPTVLYTTTLMLMVLPLSAGARTVAHAMRGLHRVVIGQAIDLLLRPALVLMFVGIVFTLWPQYRQPHVAMAAQLLAALGLLIAGGLVLKSFIPAPAKIAPPVYRGREWLRSALPFTLIGGAGIINSHTDIIMLGWFIGKQEVGIYRVAVQGATLVAFSLQVANAVVAPQFARIYAQRDMATLQRLVTRSAQIILVAALPVALAFALAGDHIVAWVFGAEFAAAHIPLAILALGQLVNAGFGSVGYLLNMTGHENISARILWQTALLNIGLNVVLIPFFGMNGAAIATAISLITWNLLLFRQVKAKMQITSTAFKFSAP